MPTYLKLLDGSVVTTAWNLYHLRFPFPHLAKIFQLCSIFFVRIVLFTNAIDKRTLYSGPDTCGGPVDPVGGIYVPSTQARGGERSSLKPNGICKSHHVTVKTLFMEIPFLFCRHEDSDRSKKGIGVGNKGVWMLSVPWTALRLTLRALGGWGRVGAESMTQTRE